MSEGQDRTVCTYAQYNAVQCSQYCTSSVHNSFMSCTAELCRPPVPSLPPSLPPSSSPPSLHPSRPVTTRTTITCIPMPLVRPLRTCARPRLIKYGTSTFVPDSQPPTASSQQREPEPEPERSRLTPFAPPSVLLWTWSARAPSLSGSDPTPPPNFLHPLDRHRSSTRAPSSTVAPSSTSSNSSRRAVSQAAVGKHPFHRHVVLRTDRRPQQRYRERARRDVPTRPRCPPPRVCRRHPMGALRT